MNLILIDAELASTQRVRDSELLRELCASTLTMYRGNDPVLPWAAYLAEVEGVWVGTCAFKTPPESGSVEIAYFTFPGYEGRGVATRMAQALIDLALRAGAACVRAQTLPEPNASTRILQKLGFRLAGTVIHPEDGTVWEWHWRRAAS